MDYSLDLEESPTHHVQFTNERVDHYLKGISITIQTNQYCNYKVKPLWITITQSLDDN